MTGVVVIVIHIVAPDIALVWLLERADLPPTTEWLCPLGTENLAWCTTERLRSAQVAGTERIGQMSLEQCRLIYEQHQGRTIAALRCGEFALVINGDPNLDVSEAFSGEALLLASSARAEQVGWTQTFQLFTGLSGRGPMPPPQPVPVTRGCKAIVTTVNCGYWATLPPPPSPCPNPRLATHNFI